MNSQPHAPGGVNLCRGEAHHTPILLTRWGTMVYHAHQQLATYTVYSPLHLANHVVQSLNLCYSPVAIDNHGQIWYNPRPSGGLDPGMLNRGAALLPYYPPKNFLPAL